MGTEPELIIAATAESYVGVPMEAAYGSTGVVRTVETLRASSLSLECGQEGFVVISAEPASAAAGRKILISGDLAAFGLGDALELTLNDFGRAVLALTGSESGSYCLNCCLEDSSLEATSEINVRSRPVLLETKSLRLALGLGFGDTARLVAANVDSAQADVLWASADPSVAVVEDGLVRAVGPGRTMVSVSAAGDTAVCMVEVLGSLRGLRLPGALTSIEDEAFRNDDSLQYVLLPEQVGAVGDYAFADEDALLLMLVPSMTTQFGANAFDGSSDVVVVGHDGSAAQAYCIDNGIPFQAVG